MLNLPLKTVVVTYLVFSSLNECAYLVVGPLELSPANGQNNWPEDDQEFVSKIVPKRQSKNKQKSNSSTVTQSSLDDIEIVEEIPYSTNLFRSSVGSKQTKTKHAKNSDNSEKVSQEIKGDVKSNKENDRSNQKTLQNEEKTSIIDNLKRELEKEREKVKNLTNELKLINTLCDESSPNYLDYDYDANNLKDGNIQSIQSSLDLYNLINSKNNKIKWNQTKGSKDLNVALDDQYRDKMDLINFKNDSQILTKINKNLFNDNVYQIPNFSVNDHKSYKPPNVLNDFPVFRPNFNRYTVPIIHTPNIVLPYKNPNGHSDILRTLYPQFFLDDQNDNFDPIINPKRSSGRRWIEPQQIYANNMKQLTAPYKLFPGNWSPDLRYFNIRDRRNYNDKNRKNVIKNNNHNLGGSLRRRNVRMDINNRIHEPFRSANVENESKFKVINSPIEENGSPFNIRKFSNDDAELAFIDKKSPKEEFESAFKSNVSSNGEINNAFKSEDTKMNVNDSENNDDDVKYNFYESSREGKPMKDFVISKKLNDKLNKWKKENELMKKEYSFYKIPDDTGPDEISKNLNDDNTKEIKDIIFKGLKLKTNSIGNENGTNASTSVIYNKEKCAKSIDQINPSAEDNIDDNKGNIVLTKLNNNLKENDKEKENIKEIVDDEELDSKVENISLKCTDKQKKTCSSEIENPKHVSFEEIADDDSGKDEAEDIQDQMDLLMKSAENKSEDNDSAEEIADDHDLVKELAADIDLDKEKADDNGSANVIADVNDSTKELAAGIDPEKEKTEDNGSANVIAEDNDSAKDVADDNDLVKVLGADIGQEKEKTEDNGSANGIAEDNDSAKEVAEDAVKEIVEDNDLLKEVTKDKVSAKDVKEITISAKQVEKNDDSVKISAEDNDWSEEVAEDDDSLNEINGLTNENELTNDLDNAEGDNSENDENTIEIEGNRRKRNIKIKQNNIIEENHNINVLPQESEKFKNNSLI